MSKSMEVWEYKGVFEWTLSSQVAVKPHPKREKEKGGWGVVCEDLCSFLSLFLYCDALPEGIWELMRGHGVWLVSGFKKTLK